MRNFEKASNFLSYSTCFGLDLVVLMIIWYYYLGEDEKRANRVECPILDTESRIVILQIHLSDTFGLNKSLNFKLCIY